MLSESNSEIIRTLSLKEHNFTQVLLMKRWTARFNESAENWRERFSGKFRELVENNAVIRRLIIDNFDQASGMLPEAVLEEIESCLYND
jgi:hypothetical protein